MEKISYQTRSIFLNNVPPVSHNGVSNSPLRNGRATQRPAGPDDGSRLGPKSADTH